MIGQALRPYATAGIAVVGAGVIAVAPVATPLPDISQVRDVQLTGTSDILSIPFNTLQDAFTNDATLSLTFVDANNALVDAIQTNPDWFSALLNPQELFGALTFLAGDQKTFLDPLAAFTLNGAGPDGSIEVDATHALLYALLTNQGSALGLPPGLLPTFDSPIPEIINFLSSPLSGVLIGAVSPLVAPLVPFLNPALELIADLENGTSPNIGELFTDLLKAPLNSIDGFFNGDVLNLDALAPLVSQLGLLPAGDEITGISFGFGGLLSPGLVGGNPADITFFGDSIPSGGSIFNALGLDLSIANPIVPGGPPLELPVLAHGVGPFGALIGLEQVFAELFSGNLDFGGDASDSGTTAAIDFADPSAFFGM